MTAALKKNFTDGPIFLRMLTFALPLMASGILQILYNFNKILKRSVLKMGLIKAVIREIKKLRPEGFGDFFSGATNFNSTINKL